MPDVFPLIAQLNRCTNIKHALLKQARRTRVDLYIDAVACMHKNDKIRSSTIKSNISIFFVTMKSINRLKVHTSLQ